MTRHAYTLALAAVAALGCSTEITTLDDDAFPLDIAAQVSGGRLVHRGGAEFASWSRNTSTLTLFSLLGSSVTELDATAPYIGEDLLAANADGNVLFAARSGDAFVIRGSDGSRATHGLREVFNAGMSPGGTAVLLGDSFTGQPRWWRVEPDGTTRSSATFDYFYPDDFTLPFVGERIVLIWPDYYGLDADRVFTVDVETGAAGPDIDTLPRGWSAQGLDASRVLLYKRELTATTGFTEARVITLNSGGSRVAKEVLAGITTSPEVFATHPRGYLVFDRASGRALLADRPWNWTLLSDSAHTVYPTTSAIMPDGSVLRTGSGRIFRAVY